MMAIKSNVADQMAVIVKAVIDRQMAPADAAVMIDGYAAYVKDARDAASVQAAADIMARWAAQAAAQ